MAKGLAHLIVADYLKLSAELNRPVPQDYYFQKGMYSKRNVDSTFGGWLQLVQAAGYHIPQVKKLDKEEIRKKSYEHLKGEVKEKKPLAIPPKLYRHIFVWSDAHFPYQHQDCVSFLIAINKKYNFDLVVDIGDAEDFHALSFHDKNVDLFSAGHELQEVIKMKQDLYKEFPNVMICESNHSSLVFRKGLHHGFPRHVLKSYKDILEAPIGWTWHHEIIVQMSNGEKCLFHHGYSANTLLASQKRGMSLIQGHFHSRFGIQYWANSTTQYFAAQTGCLIDDTKMAFAYNKLTIERPILGCLRIENGTPHLLPMYLNNYGRWNGVVP